MNHYKRIGMALVACLGIAITASAASAPPVAPIKPVTDTLYGVKVTDPYRYMENLKDPAVEKWFKQENAYTRSVLDAIPGRKQLLADIEKYDNSDTAEVSNVVRLPGEVYFYEKTLPGQEVARLYMRHGLGGREKVLFDPAKYDEKGGSHWSINYYYPSYDGHYVAIGISPGGSEMAVLHVLDARTGQETGEAITRVGFAQIAWKHDNRSFFYPRMRKLSAHAPASEKYDKSRVYLHVVGTDPARDKAVFGYGVSSDVAVEPSDSPYVVTSAKSPYALGVLKHGVQGEITLYKAPLDKVGKADTPWKKIADVHDDVVYYAIAMHDDDLYLLSHKDAPRYKVVHIDLAHPADQPENTFVAQGKAVIKDIAAGANALYVEEADGLVGKLVRVAYKTGVPQETELPYEGIVGLGDADTRIPGVLFNLTSWIRAPAIFKFDPTTNASVNTHLQPAGPSGNRNDLTSVEVKAKSYDGTLVPLSIIYRKGTKLDGTNPTLLLGYGAYGGTFYPDQLPYAEVRSWYNHGGIIAIAHVRGGGVYGEAWHKAGQKLTKPNSWRDFIACAQYLIGHKYTAPARLGIWGVSAGGLLVIRATTERPDLFAAAIDQVGPANVLRYEVMPSGPANVPEFGSIKTQAGFEDLYAMDSYQHVRNGAKYPAVMLTTGWNDPRVSPWQAGKMAARLQAATASGKPVLLRVNYHGGHGNSAFKSQNETLWADAISFALWQLGVPGFQPHH
ncbi:MAG: prolyl oligopeptidase family serine peptidase [Gammaproteobacteria bacterium]